MSDERTMRNECWSCIHRRSIPGDAHIRCAKPDPNMKGHARGIERGWFIYPVNFDPCWKESLCANHDDGKGGDQ